MLSTTERNTIADIKARLVANRPVTTREKQMMLDLVKREGLSLSSKAIDTARKEGLNVDGIKSL